MPNVFTFVHISHNHQWNVSCIALILILTTYFNTRHALCTFYFQETDLHSAQYCSPTSKSFISFFKTDMKNNTSEPLGEGMHCSCVILLWAVLYKIHYGLCQTNKRNYILQGIQFCTRGLHQLRVWAIHLQI